MLALKILRVRRVIVEEFLNLYHQKLWEIAFGHVEKVFGVFFVILLVLSIFPSYIYFNSLVKRKSSFYRLHVFRCVSFSFFVWLQSMPTVMIKL